MRTCIACSSKTAKRELLRIVAKPDGGIAFDASGKLSGRGAYLCPDCAGSSGRIRRGRLERTLRTAITDAQWEEVVAAMNGNLEAPVG